MKKPENKKKRASEPKSPQTAPKSYNKTTLKANQKSDFDRKAHVKKMVEKREARRKKALEAVPIEEVAQDLQLKKKEGVNCPYCESEKSVELDNQKNHFHCSSCKKKGNSSHLVQKIHDLTYWKSISYLEELAKKEAAQKKHEEPPKQQSCFSSNRPPSEQERNQAFSERVQKAKQTSRLEKVIEHEAGVQFKQTGTNLVCRCPFPDHNDKTPSFTVNPHEQLFHCFGCNRGGDVLTFLQLYRNFSFAEALNYLEGTNSTAKRYTVQRAPIHTSKLLARCCNFFHIRLAESAAVKQFLQSRSLWNTELISHFRLGFDDGKINQTISPDLKESLQNLGMLNGNGNIRFYKCLTVGLTDTEGNTVGIYGRRLDCEKGSKHQLPKAKIKGILNAAALNSSRELFLTEGALDAFALWIMGFRNVSAVLSASFISSFLIEKILSSQIEKIYLVLDSDEAGEKACLALAEKLKGIEIRRIHFTDGIKDANELLMRLGTEQARENFIQLIKKSVSFSSKSIATAHNLSSVDVPITVGKEQIEATLEDRRYCIRGLDKNLSPEVMRVNLAVFCLDKFEIDTLDLYQARQRAMFIKNAASELGVKREVIKKDLSRLLLKLMKLQEQNITRTLEVEKKAPVMSEAEELEALSYLKSLNLVDKISEDFEYCGLIGEKYNALIGYFASLSRKQPDPIMLIVQASSAAGKSSLMEAILAFIPEEDLVKFTAMTGQSLFYMGETELVNKTLAISEEEGAEKATYAIKIMQSEKELKIASTGKNPKDGKLATHEYKVNGPVQTMFTTTAPEVDEELQNRGFVITVNEEREQTQSIHQLQRHRETLSGIMWQRRREKLIKLHQNIQRLIKPMLVVNPYAEKLTFLDTRLRTRRDHPKYLTLIRTIALLHQHQRKPKKAHEDDEVISYIEVEPKDIELANTLVAKVMGHSLSELAPQTQRLLDLLWKMVESHCEENDMPQREYRFTRREVREYTGWGDTQLKIHLQRLVDLEYLVIYRGCHSQRYLYELIYRGEGKDGELFLPSLINPKSLKLSPSHKQKPVGVKR